ncbi:HupE/UreJ family protein [Nocardiopsis sp. NRRL B-16309]|uniref:HupE/UreJ family protein n=1 Tax=Nocardiopsis sp. NRRL B-16309 TaxID=1519494 RepID=UPI0009EBE546|nr:HupE/UreJ family protein [Nocardiopsis sp. NRRL B-16309]
MARRLVPVLLVVVIALTAGPVPAVSAHPQSTSAVLLDIHDDRVEGEVQLPIDRLAVGVDRDLTAQSVLAEDRDFLADYTAEHIGATGEDGQDWTADLGEGAVRVIDGVDHLVHPLTLTPPDRHVTDFDLHYDVIVESLLTHKIIVTVRYDFDSGILKTDDAETLGVIDFATPGLDVPAGDGSWLRGFTATAGLGMEHVAEGADHLLFLIVLLLPAPLVAVGGRWRSGSSPRRALVRVVHVVTAFAIGHSLTLALAATGVVDLPSRPVETLIALSIAVSAVHAIRPLVARGEVLIAGGFGLVHGLAFASLIADLGLNRGSLVTTLLGFNLGIEVTQLLLVALVMPALVLMARTPIYPAFRVGVAAVALVFSVSWMLERSTLTPVDPFEGAQTWLVEHPLLVAVAVTALAATAYTATRGKRVPVAVDGSPELTEAGPS